MANQLRARLAQWWNHWRIPAEPPQRPTRASGPILDEGLCGVWMGATFHPLMAIEYRLLQCLVHHEGHVISP